MLEDLAPRLAGHEAGRHYYAAEDVNEDFTPPGALDMVGPGSGELSAAVSNAGH